jgi:Skp family chaperone for outer membrane proteins
MKKLLLLAAALTVIPGLAMAQPGKPLTLPSQPAQQNNQLPAPKVLVINRPAIMQASKVGQDIARQVQAYANQAKAEMEGQAKALQTEGQALQQQIAILAPDVKQKKIDEYQKKEAALQGMAQRREQQIQGGVIAAQQQVEAVMGPILQGIMQQRGANMILDKSAVVFASSSAFDITQAAIDQLNQKMSTVKVTLQNPSAGAPAPARAPAPAPAKK